MTLRHLRTKSGTLADCGCPKLQKPLRTHGGAYNVCNARAVRVVKYEQGRGVTVQTLDTGETFLVAREDVQPWDNDRVERFRKTGKDNRRVKGTPT